MNTAQPCSLQRRQFASDNYAPIVPEAWLALEQANVGHAVAYGGDGWAARAVELVQRVFETECHVFFTFNGTAANSLSLASLCQPYNSVICHENSHIQVDECGAPEFFSGGAKLLTVGGEHAKVDLTAVNSLISARAGDVHFPQPRAMSITQATEYGTLYTKDELMAIADVARHHDLLLHMDGARFANAVAALGVAPKEITWESGVDVLSFGGTKLGLPVGELVVFFDSELAGQFEPRRKQAAQLASKMRFLAAPWVGVLENGAWLRHAAHTNLMAARLSRALVENISCIELLAPTESNAVFVRLPTAVAEELRARGWVFYTFIGNDGVRLMCSWDTTDEDVDHFVADVRDCMHRVGDA